MYQKISLTIIMYIVWPRAGCRIGYMNMRKTNLYDGILPSNSHSNKPYSTTHPHDHSVYKNML